MARDAGGAYRASVDVVRRHFGVQAHEFRRQFARGGVRPLGDVAVARRTAIYLAVVAHNAGVRSVARAAGLSPEGVRKALASIEERRDDPLFDRMIERLETEVAA